MKIIKGRQGSGKTFLMFREIASLPEDTRIFIVVPDQYTYVMERELFERLGTDAVSRISVTGVTRFAMRVLEDMAPMDEASPGEDARRMMIRCAVDRCASSLTAFGSVAGRQGFTEKLSVLFGELEKGGISPDMLSSPAGAGSMLDRKLNDASVIYREYCRMCTESGGDWRDLSVRCAPLLKDYPQAVGSWFFFDGFNDFDPSDYVFITELERVSRGTLFTVLAGEEEFFSPGKSMIRKLRACAKDAGKSVEEIDAGEKKTGPEAVRYLEKTYGRRGVSPCPAEQDSVMLSRFRSVRDEVIYTAKVISELIRSGRYRYSDISVTVSDLTSYAPEIEDVFGEYSVPCFIDMRRQISYLPPVRSFLFLTGSNRDPGSSDMISLAKAFFPKEKRDLVMRLENYVKAHRLTGRDFFSPFSFPEKEDEGEPEELNGIREELAGMVSACRQALEGASTVREYAQKLYSYIASSGFGEYINGMVTELRDRGDYENANIYAQIYNRIVRLTDSLYRYFPDTPYSEATVRSMIRESLSAVEVAVIPSVMDRVSVGDAQRSRSGPAVVSFILGADEGKLPDTGVSPSIFTDAEKASMTEGGIELRNTARYRLEKQRLVIYSLLSRPEEKLFVSGVTDGDSSVSGRIYEELKNIFGEKRYPLPAEAALSTPEAALNALSVEMSLRRFSPERATSDRALYDSCLKLFETDPDLASYSEIASRGLTFTNDAVITDKDAYARLMLFDDRLHTSISRLERYAACPFAFFAQYVLNIKEDKEDTVDLSDTGNVVHEVIERFSRMMLDSGTLPGDMDDEDVEKKAQEITKEVLEGYRTGIYSMLAGKEYWVKRLNRTCVTAIREILRQMRRSDFLLSAAEIDFDRTSAITVDIEGVGKAVLKGRIDRADSWEDPSGRKYIRIVDYKTGSTSFDLTKIYYGLSMQLPIYMHALSDAQGSSPAGMFYLRLSNALVSVNDAKDLDRDRLEKAVRERFRLNGLILDDLSVVRAMDTGDLSDSYIESVNAAADSSLKENDNLRDEAFFTKVIDKSLEKAAEFSSRIIEGKIPISPYSDGEHTPCTWCAYRGMCHFTEGLSENTYRRISAARAKEYFAREDVNEEEGKEEEE